MQIGGEGERGWGRRGGGGGEMKVKKIRNKNIEQCEVPLMISSASRAQTIEISKQKYKENWSPLPW